MHYNIFRNGMVLTFALSNAAQHGKRCNALIETSPWRISDFLVRNALPTASTGSSIHFHITDTNKGLEFQTSCGGTMSVGTGLTPDKAYGWQQCEDERVSFLYQQSNIQIRRSYVDDCLGDPPYNGGTFYGSADTDFRITRTDSGEIWTQVALDVPATSQVA